MTENTPQRKRHRLEAPLYAVSSHAYFFTVCARHQGQPFRNVALADTVIQSLLWTRSHYHWHLFCYCLMPDHLHFLCRLADAGKSFVNAGARGVQPEGVLDHLSRFKSFTTHASWKLGLRGPLWQKSSYDRIIDLEKPFEEVAQYVLENPVRKGWVKEWSEWPYSQIVDPW